jgi:hypothetical protein
MAEIVLDRVTKELHNGFVAIDDVSLETGASLTPGAAVATAFAVA